MEPGIVLAEGKMLDYVYRCTLWRPEIVSVGIANLIGIGIAAIANYLINSNWTWRRET